LMHLSLVPSKLVGSMLYGAGPVQFPATGNLRKMRLKKIKWLLRKELAQLDALRLGACQNLNIAVEPTLQDPSSSGLQCGNSAGHHRQKGKAFLRI